jgi:hypothetical protein
MTDAAILVEAGTAGAPLNEVCALLESRIKRTEPWEPERALAAARVNLAPSAGKATQTTTDIRLVGMRNAKPRRFVWEFAGQRFENSVEDVDSRRAFSKWAKGYLPSLPSLPSAKEWEGWLAAEMETAPQEEVDDEDTEEGYIREVIAGLLSNMQLTEDAAEFKAGKAVMHNGRRVVSATGFLHKVVKPEVSSLSPSQLYIAFKALGWFKSDVFKIGKATVRGWCDPVKVESTVLMSAERIMESGRLHRLALVPDEPERDDIPFFDDVGGAHD